MELQYERQIVISTGSNRKDMNWKPQTLLIGEMWERLRTPQRGTETQTEYLKLKKAQQDELKDVGGFVGGTLAGGQRKSNAVTGRDLISLDFDTIPAYGAGNLLTAAENLGAAYCVYSTRKHMETKPRLRVILPLNRTVTADEYEPVARWIAAQMGIQMADPTTFQPSRLMYWPSCSSDGEYIFKYKDAPLIDADKVLATYSDWRDITSWPQVPGADTPYQKLAMKQGDPEAKPGTVGAFCKSFDVFKAMETFLPGIYEPVANDPNRYTYLGGSTTGGAVIYDNGKFLFSHHATDPCSGKLVNAFDLVRLHKFGDMDNEAKEGTPSNRLPSYTAMCELAAADPTVSAFVIKERREEALKDFEGVQATNTSDSISWFSKLKINPQTGQIAPTLANITAILENDELLSGRCFLSTFYNRIRVISALPWNLEGTERLWDDHDANGLYQYLETGYGIPVSKSKSVDISFDNYVSKHKVNEVQSYIEGLSWDGVRRLDTLLIDYLGAEDDEAGYTRAVCRKSFTAAVARAMKPGCKFDNMLILVGPQGMGKSTLLDKMSRGWFNDSIRTFEGKEASELLAGSWIIEVAELDAFRRTDVGRIKQFISLRADKFRAAYGRHTGEYPRSCVFFGTCNRMDFLQDATGNRRFWPVDVGITKPAKRTWDLSDSEIDQIWAEAKMRWQMGESLHLTGELEEIARARQEDHRETSPQEGSVLEFISRQIPRDWDKWTLDRRRDFWATQVHGEYELVERQRVCAQEIWTELYCKRIEEMKRTDVREINDVLRNAPEWESVNDFYPPHNGNKRLRHFARKPLEQS